jgi:ubiquinone/menaquinone biosynthesis C-methylase UbiE
MASAEAVQAYKDRVRDTWRLGEYGKLAERVFPIAEHLCRSTEVGPGDKVVDIATGTGNVAIAAARRGADVVAVDLTPRMVDLARARAAAEGVPLRVVLGDAEDLEFPSASFDVALSACGLWWAPRPDVAVAEVRRVLRPGGVVGLAGFTPDSYFGQVEEVIKARVPLPEGVPERNDWAREDLASERLATHFVNVRAEVGILPWRFDSAAQATAFLFDNSASHIAAYRSLDAAAGAALAAEVERLTAASSTSADGVHIDLAYMVVTGRVQG